MFICDKCKKVQGPGIKASKVVVETRKKEYLPRPDADDRGGIGYETVREESRCPPCAVRN